MQHFCEQAGCCDDDGNLARPFWARMNGVDTLIRTCPRKNPDDIEALEVAEIVAVCRQLRCLPTELEAQPDYLVHALIHSPGAAHG